MDQVRMEQVIASRLKYAVDVAFQNMTPEAKIRALETPDISALLMELLKWVPVYAPDPDWEKF